VILDVQTVDWQALVGEECGNLHLGAAGLQAQPGGGDWQGLRPSCGCREQGSATGTCNSKHRRFKN